MTTNATTTDTGSNTSNSTASNFLCSACSVSFRTDLQRREHMKSEWHVANVKRRVASLPSITQEQHTEELQQSRSTRTTQKPTLSRQQSDQEEDEGSESDLSSDSSETSDEETHLIPTRCLFCLLGSSAIGTNVSHMETAHGLHIPNKDQLQEGLEPLLWYLDLVINRFFSCLYCGNAKRSAEATRAHMLDKGHCMLDLAPGSEYLEFWESKGEAASEEEVHEEGHITSREPRMLSSDEIALGSGRIVVRRKIGTHSKGSKRTQRKEENALITQDRSEEPAAESTEKVSSRDVQLLSNRDRMGLIGLSNAEQRLILATEKRMRSQQSKKWSARHWTTENISTSIKRTVFKQNLAGG